MNDLICVPPLSYYVRFVKLQSDGWGGVGWGWGGNLNCVFCTCSETFLTNSEELIITGRSGIEMLGVTERRALMTMMRPPGVTVKCLSCVDTRGPAPAHHHDRFGFG